MKKKTGTLAIIVLLAVLVLGIGYAYATVTLNINGTLGANADDANFKVKFTNAVAGTPTKASSTVTPTVEAGVTNDLTATFKVTNFTAKNDTVDFTYDVKNESTDLVATVEAKVADTYGNSDYFSVATKWADDGVLEAGETEKLTVTVTCIKTPIAEVTEVSTDAIVTLTATASEKNN